MLIGGLGELVLVFGSMEENPSTIPIWGTTIVLPINSGRSSEWRWSYRYTTAPGQRCKLAEATVLMKSTIVLPEWTNVSTAPPEIADGWRPFLEALTRHEEGHRSRAKAQGVFLWQSLIFVECRACLWSQLVL